MKLESASNKKILLFKVILWRCISVISMLLTMWLLTGNIAEATGLTIVVQIIQTIVHGVFEILWEKYTRNSYKK